MNYSYPGNNQILISEKTLLETPHTYLHGGQIVEWEMITFMTDFLSKHNQGVVVDIGAQVGLYSLTAKYNPGLTYHSFEPYTGNYENLLDNITLNEIDNIVTYKLAVSDKIGESVLNVCTSHMGLHTMGDNSQRFSNSQKTIIQTTTLDTIFAHEDNILYIKIDTEGYEYFILLGAIELLKRCKPVLQLEIYDQNLAQCGVNKADLLKLLDDLNYQLVYFNGNEDYVYM